MLELVWCGVVWCVVLCCVVLEKSGKTADAGKMKEDERAYNTYNERSSIFFFAVETSGGLGKEAREFVKLLAKMSGGDLFDNP
jgi:hypothetical protein